MARTNGKVYIVIDKLSENRSTLSGLLSDIKRNKDDIKVDMLSLFDNYESPNTTSINTKITEIDDSIKTFITGEDKVPKTLLPDVNRRFHRGSEIAKQKAKETKSTNNSVLETVERSVQSSLIANYNELTAKKAMEGSKTSDHDKNVEGFAPNVRDLGRNGFREGISSVSSDSKTMKMESREILSYFASSIYTEGDRLKITLKYQVVNEDKTRQVLTARLDVPVYSIIKGITLVLTGSSNISRLNFYKDNKNDKIVITPEEFDAQMVAKLVLAIKENPVEFLNSLVVNSSEKLTFSNKIQGVPEVDLVVADVGTAKLGELLEQPDLVADLDTVYVDDTSKLDSHLDEYSVKIEEFDSKVSAETESKLDDLG